MNYNNKVQQRSVVGVMAFGCGICIILTILGALVAAYALKSEYLAENRIGVTVMAITGISSAIGALMATRNMQTKLLPSALLVGGAYYAVMLFAGIALFDGPSSGAIATGILAVGCSGCVALLRVKGAKRKLGHVRKYPNR